MKRPNSQITEGLYLLINREAMTRADFFNEAHILNAPELVRQLRAKEVDIETQMISTANKFGREVQYGVYMLKNKNKAEEVYNELVK